MSNNQLERFKVQDDSPRPQEVVKWARCHPGVVSLDSPRVGAVLACGRNADQQTNAQRPAETGANIIDGDAPLFV